MVDRISIFSRRGAEERRSGHGWRERDLWHGRGFRRGELHSRHGNERIPCLGPDWFFRARRWPEPEIHMAFGSDIGEKAHILFSADYNTRDEILGYAGRDWYDGCGLMQNSVPANVALIAGSSPPTYNAATYLPANGGSSAAVPRLVPQCDLHNTQLTYDGLLTVGQRRRHSASMNWRRMVRQCLSRTPVRDRRGRDQRHTGRWRRAEPGRDGFVPVAIVEPQESLPVTRHRYRRQLQCLRVRPVCAAVAALLESRR